MASKHREEHIREAVACPLCGAAIGQACRVGTLPHDQRRGIEDLRPILHRSHQERREAWQEWKQLQGAPVEIDMILPFGTQWRVWLTCGCTLTRTKDQLKAEQLFIGKRMTCATHAVK